ncbi:MAG: methyl-accepting chemotaxis protein [Planctomycetota bacterium]|nr:methyl-accepting chemotaxis protein [Planctomycetota bacterium]
MQVLHDMRVMAKLMLAAALMCVIVIAVGLVGVTEVSDMRDIADTMYHHEVLGVAAAQEVDIGVLKVLDRVEHALAHPETLSEMRTKIAEHTRGIQRSLEQLAESNGTEAADKEEKEVRAEMPLFLGLADEVLNKIAANDIEAAQAAEKKLIQSEEKLDRLTHELTDHRLERARHEDAQAAAIHDQSKRFMFLFIAAAVILGFGAAYIVARSISVPLRESVDVLEDVAAGDLTSSLELDRKDELGQMANALNAALGSMRDALTEVRGAAMNVAGTAGQLQAAAQDISSGSQEQASGLEEAAASLEEMAEAIRQNADGAQRANEVSVASRETAEHGGRIVSEAVEAMDGANEASQRIAQIIGTIDEIAFQTNLLALNAAVEAARAGEQGRGFAVVASEVRNLAQRSASAAKEIKELIQDSVSRVENGSRLVNESGESLETIVDSVKRVTDLVGEIAAASKEQSIGVDHVNTAVMQADRVTQGNAAQTEELSGSAESLAANSQQLLSLVSRFKVEHGEASIPQSGRPSAPVLSLHPSPTPGPSTSTPLAPTGTDGYEEF